MYILGYPGIIGFRGGRSGAGGGTATIPGIIAAPGGGTGVIGIPTRAFDPMSLRMNSCCTVGHTSCMGNLISYGSVGRVVDRSGRNRLPGTSK